MKQWYFEDLQVGQKWKSPSKTINDAHFLLFAGITGDNPPIHYDYEFAKTSKFGLPVTHGLLVASLTALGGSEATFHFVESIIAFLEQGSKFLKPVLVGDTVYTQFEITELVNKNDFGIMTITTKVINQKSDVCMEGFHKYMVRYKNI